MPNAISYCRLQAIKCGQGITRWQEDLRPLPPKHSIKYVEYHWGPPGIGKSTTIAMAHPNAFIKDCDTKWWDNYKGQAEFMLDDFSGIMTAITAKKWLGEVNVPLKIRGGATDMRYSTIIITSNVQPEDVLRLQRMLSSVCVSFPDCTSTMQQGRDSTRVTLLPVLICEIRMLSSEGSRIPAARHFCLIPNPGDSCVSTKPCWR